MEPLGICRTAFYVSKKIMCAVLIVFSLRGRAQSSVMMEKETCAFLQSLPAVLSFVSPCRIRYYSVACVDLLTWGWLVFREYQ